MFPWNCVGVKPSAYWAPTAAAKSTLLQTLVGRTPLLAGCVRVDDTPLFALPAVKRAQVLSLLLQVQSPDPTLTVRELVELGRTPYLNAWGILQPKDRLAVEKALSTCGLEALAERRLGTLSGGERQRARLAMVLAQETPFLLLDEPTNHLDVGHRYELHQLLRKLQAETRLGLLVVLHGVEDAFRFGDAVGVVLDGQLRFFEQTDRAQVQTLLSERYRVPTEWVY